MGIWIAPAGLVAVAAWLGFTYNRLVALRNQVQNAWRQIDVQLRRRHDLIPNLVETVRGVMRFEQDTLTAVIEARNAAARAQGVAEVNVAERGLSEALGRLFALAEAYPELKSNQNARALQEELTTTENRIAFARQLYNDLVMRYNTAQETVPSNLVARGMGAQPAVYFEAAPTEREAPRVDLAIR